MLGFSIADLLVLFGEALLCVFVSVCERERERE